MGDERKAVDVEALEWGDSQPKVCVLCRNEKPGPHADDCEVGKLAAEVERLQEVARPVATCHVWMLMEPNGSDMPDDTLMRVSIEYGVIRKAYAALKGGK